MTQSHTPTPWQVLTSPIYDEASAASLHFDWCIWGGAKPGQAGTPIAHIPMVDGQIMQSEWNAAFIVRACNSHAALVAALRQSVKWLEMVAEPSASGMAYYPQFSADLKIARAALAAVEKDQS